MHATPPFPGRINVEPTNHCNQRCRLCPRLGFSRPLGFMEMEVFERVARECAGHDTRLWLHFLGEPLLHRRLIEMVAFAKQVGVATVGLSTNAVSLHPAVADGLIEAGLDRLECSLDAGDREGYLDMRGRDHFERVERNVRGFLERKRARGKTAPVTSIQFMRTPAVEASLVELVDRWRPLLGPRDFVMTIAPAGFVGAVETGPATEATRPPCAWLESALMVHQDGVVTMCGADWDAESPIGRIGEATLAEIWHGPEMARRRRAHAEGRFADVAPCGDCQDWRLADGSGYVNALDEVDAARTALRGRAG